jgi:hypothetical protein
MMKQLNALTIKLGMIIFATASIVTACTMNCGCCDPESAKNTEIAACCTELESTNSLVPAVNTTLNLSGQNTQDVCSSCNCNPLPVKESNAVSSGSISLKIHTLPVSVLIRSHFAQDNYSVKTSFASLNSLSAPLIPLRI